jgi:hypothetical protein
MPKFSIDYQQLSNSVEKKVYKLSEVQHRLEKVAFDVVRFRDGDPEELWQIQNSDDGDYIVARYETDAQAESPKTEKTASSNAWEVLVNEASGDINIFYKGFPVVRASLEQTGLPKDSLGDVKKYLPKWLNTEKQLVQSLLKTLSTTERYELLRLYPELS